ncbi:tetratricopeptide repeat protein [Pinirhizobacter sp.]|uniref:tetratricopeptide repeat protein n=1 Tax=Pinirhizobacter sp. TaxID=2950432 RepID=UPI002F41C085
MDRLNQLRAFAQQDPGNDRLLLDFLDELLAAGQLDEAADVASRVSASTGSSEPVALRSARLALQTGRFREANFLLAGLLAGGLDTPAVRHDLSFARLCMGELDAAEATLAPMIPQSVTVPAIGLLHARLLQHRRQFDDAMLIVQAVLAENASMAEAWGLLAMLHLDLAQADQARAAAERALSLQTGQSDALTVLGTLHLWSHDASAAYQAFSAILSTQPAAGRALAGAGEALMLRGDIGSARAFLDRAVKFMPQHLGTWHALAWCDLLEGDIASAAASFDQAMALDRNFGETHGGLAVISALNGRTEDARSQIKVAMRLDPSGRNARYAQSLLWQTEGREQDAAALVEGILAEAGVNAQGGGAVFIGRLRDQLRKASVN